MFYTFSVYPDVYHKVYVSLVNLSMGTPSDLERITI
jgi:hypothetical protein